MGFSADYHEHDVTVTAAVPEPEQYLMLLAGLGLVGAIARRRQIIILGAMACICSSSMHTQACAAARKIGVADSGSIGIGINIGLDNVSTIGGGKMRNFTHVLLIGSALLHSVLAIAQDSPDRQFLQTALLTSLSGIPVVVLMMPHSIGPQAGGKGYYRQYSRYFHCLQPQSRGPDTDRRRVVRVRRSRL